MAYYYSYEDRYGRYLASPDRRAKALLRERLTPEQLTDYNQSGGFNVIGSDSRRYRITDAGSYSVISDRGTQYCAYPVACDEYGDPYLPLPIADRMLGIKLVLEGNARYFRWIAHSRPFETYSKRPKAYPIRTRRQKVKRFFLATRYALIPVSVVAVGHVLLGIFS